MWCIASILGCFAWGVGGGGGEGDSQLNRDFFVPLN